MLIYGGIKMLWTEKYRPNKLNDLIGQEKNMPNVLIHGNPGNGKTSASLVLAKEILGESFIDNYIEVNASDDRRLETVRTTIKNIAQSATIGDAPFRIVLLDEMDGMTKDIRVI